MDLYGGSRRPPFWDIPDPAFLYHQSLILQQRKRDAQQALDKNRLSEALHLYTETLNLAQCFPHLFPEIPKILSNRSLVYCRQRHFTQALEDANESIRADPQWIKGYWRAAQAHKGMNQMYSALNALIAGYSVALDCQQEDEVVSIVSEIVTVIIQIPGDPEHLLQNSKIFPGPVKSQVKILQRLSNNHCWEGVSLLVIGIHTGPHSSLDGSAATCPAESLSVGSLLKNSTPEQLKRYGIKLAIVLMENGATCQEIEYKMNMPVVHVGVKMALATGNLDFIKALFNTFITEQERKNAVDNKKRTAFHILVQSGKINSNLGETLLRLLLNNGCQPSFFDEDGKLPLDYLQPHDVGYSILSASTKFAGNAVKTSIKKLREEGNAAYKNGNLSEALIQYSRAISMSENYSNLTRDQAMLLTNRSAVFSALMNIVSALEDAENAVKLDPEWFKGHYKRGHLLRQMENYRESYSAFLEGYRKSDCSISEKCSILVDAMVSFQKIEGFGEIEASYRGLSKVTTDVWTEVLSRLSKQSEWLAIRYLILGTTIRFREGTVTPLGYAHHADFRGMTYSTIFPYLRQQTDKESAGAWMTPLVLYLITFGEDLQNFLRFRESDEDTPLHAAAKFCILTGDLTVMTHMPESLPIMHILDGYGDTPYHTVLKMPPPHNKKHLSNLIKLMLRKRISAIVRDKSGLLPIDYINIKTQQEVYDILRRVSKPTEKPSVTAKSSSKVTDTNNKPDTAPPSEPVSDNTDNMVKLQKDRANDEFKSGNFEKALHMYSDAIDMLSKHLQLDLKGHELAVLHGNKAECFLKLGQYSEALDEAIESVGFEGHWFKAHLRVGKAQAALGRHKNAVQAFMNSCKELEDTSANNSIRREILFELSLSFRKENRMPSMLFSKLELKGASASIWALVTYDLVCQDHWEAAEFAFRQYTLYSWSSGLQKIKLDLSPLCNLNHVETDDWVLALIKYFLERGCDPHTLSVEKGDTYFHAVVKMSLVSGVLELLGYLLPRIVANSEQNMVDSKGDTVLHLAVKERHTLPQLRLHVVVMLVEAEVSLLIRNREDKLAMQYIPKGENPLMSVLVQATVQQEGMEKEVRKRQIKQEQERLREDRKKQQELYKLQQQEKRQEAERRKLQQDQKKSEAKSRKQQTENASNVTKDYQCENACEPLIQEGKELLQNNNIRHAYQTFANVLKKKHNSDKHKGLENFVLSLVINSLGQTLNPEIPERLAKIPLKLYERLVHGLAENEKWKQMHIAVKEYKSHHGDLALPDFAKNLSLAKVIRHSSFQGSEQTLVDIVETMLNSGAVLQKEGKLAILAAVQECQFRVLEVLFRWNANPVHLSINHGDTPIHAALSIALERDKGNFSILSLFFEMYEKDGDKYSMLDPSQQNEEGDGLFHLVAKAKYSATTQKATEFLCDKKVHASVYNKEGKLPKDYLNSKNDRRLQFFRLASVGGVIKPKKRQRQKMAQQEDTNTLADDREDLQQYERGQDTPQVQEEAVERKTRARNVPTAKKEAVKRKIEDLIYNLPDIPYSIFNPKVPKTDEVQNAKRKKIIVEEPKEASEPPKVVEDMTEGTPVDEDVLVQEDVESDELEIDPQVFDNLEWEVECTADVWKAMRDKHILPEMKQRIIRKIQLLARGEWHPHLCKEVKNVPDTLSLYEAKLSKGSRILWELAIAFSPRLSETAERRLQLSDDVDDQPVKGGRIYSEVIRVWDIVLDHDKIYRSVQKIIKSHSRGEECIIQKKLKGVKQPQFQAGIRKRFPMIFAESDADIDAKELQERQQNLQQYYPPASSNETEYHILKFYSFSSSLVSHVLQNLETKVDFPFRVTDLEHAIINLKSKAPILLLGRSGTGKTTCCLYRLWSQYVSYWSKAKEADAKLLPRCQVFREDEEELEEESGSDEEDGTEEEMDEEVEIPQEELEEQAEGEEEYDHLHQIFITKNVVLCSEVQKNFRELSHACDVAKDHVAIEDQVIPHKLQDVSDFQYPLFITSKKLLMMLDASLGTPYFFDRNEDGSLKADIQGWSESEGLLNFLPMLQEDSDDEDDEEEERYEEDDVEDDNDANIDRRQRRKVDPRREVTYEVFVEEVWPRISKKWANKYHPSLIWMEIMSFIRGSFEALSKPGGFLEKQEYLDLGKKRAPNFSGEREHIYAIFKKYDHFKRQKFLFDETDLVFDVYRRLKKEKDMHWIIHQIFVDETQDFTQAELCLLLRLCQTPNEMFLTGDTAQSIMRGIAFRFSDLRSLFYYARHSLHAIGKSSGVHVPKQVYQLTHNYRSHAGILFLASSILDLMVEFFPESFDRLQKDQGLFQGPPPVLLESCSFSDLAMLLRGNKRKTSHIEFGAHQAILVVNEAARDSIPEELHLGLILTIYEAKGLEFDDILLYNFFKDSQASKEWRVVTEFLEKLLASCVQKSTANPESLVEIDTDVLKLSGRPRPLSFDPNHHKVLNAELKHLYTAVTRARVNVWIFDEDMDKRAPMFEYFKARKLVRSITSTEVEEDQYMLEVNLKLQFLTGVYVPLLRTLLSDSVGGMFAEESTPQEWLKRGDEFMKHSLYEVAAKCFNRGQDSYMESVAHAHQSALIASRMKDNPPKMREAFLFAAEKFLECELPSKAVICLQNARERELVAHLYEKTNQLERAGETYRKLKKPIEGSRCYEQLGKFNLAVETLCENDMFEMAIDTLRRYKLLKEDLAKKGIPLPQVLRENVPRKLHNEAQLSFKAAEVYHASKNHPKMMAALGRLPKIEDRTSFLIRRNYISEAADLLQENGDHRKACDLYMKRGMSKEALDCAQRSEEKDLIGHCLVLDSILQLGEKNEVEEQAKDEICRNLDQAFYLMHDLENKVAAGEAFLIRGEITGKIDFINKSFGAFTNSKPFSNNAGQLECMHWMVHNSDLKETMNLRKCILGMQNLFRVLQILIRPSNDGEKKRQIEICKFYGLHEGDDVDKLDFYPQQKPRVLKMWQSYDKRKFCCSVEKSTVRLAICEFLVKRGLEWQRKLNSVIEEIRAKHVQCPNFILGDVCKGLPKTDPEDNSVLENIFCISRHEPYSLRKFIRLIQIDLMAIELEKHIHDGVDNVYDRDRDCEINWEAFLPVELIERYRACYWLIGDLIPATYHLSIMSTKPNDPLEYLRACRKNADLKERMGRLLRCQYEEMKNSERKDNIKIFIDMLFLNQLLNLKLSPSPRTLMYQFETDITEEFSKYGKAKVPKIACSLGFMLDVDRENIRVSSVARRFYDGYDKIMGTNNDPAEALVQFTKFCVLIGKAEEVDLFPSKRLFFLWVEYYTTVAFCLSAQVQDSPNFFFVVPESYFAVINYIDSSFIYENGVPTLEAVNRHVAWRNQAAEIKLYTDRIKRIIGILCGYDSRMNLIQHMFTTSHAAEDSQENIYGIAERLLVLCIVILCNMGKSVFPDTEAKLMGELCKVKLSEDFPTRMFEALEGVQTAKGPAELAKILQKLLAQRESDSLKYCLWTKSKSRYGLKMHQLKPDELPETFLLDDTIQAMKKPHDLFPEEEKYEDTGDIEDEYVTITMEERMKMDRERSEQDRKKKECNASSIITQFLRKCVTRIQCAKLSVLVKDQIEREKQKEKMMIFESVQITDTMCGICGEQLLDKNEQTFSHMEAYAWGQQQTGLPVPAVSPNVPSPEQIKSNPFAKLLENPVDFFTAGQQQRLCTREEHEQSDKHKRMIQHQIQFRTKYKKQIAEPLLEVKEFVNRYKLRSDAAEKKYPDHPLDIQRLCLGKAEVESEIERIVSEKDWENDSIVQKVQEMTGHYHTVKKYVEETAQSIKERADKQREKALNRRQQEENWEDEIEDVVPDPKTRVKGRGRGRGRKRND